MTRDEFRKKIATAEGRAELGLPNLTADDAAAFLADDVRLDQLHSDVESRLAAEAAAHAGVPAEGERSVAAEPAKRAGLLNKKEKLGFLGLVVAVAAVFVVGVVIHNVNNAGTASDDEGDSYSASADEPVSVPTPEREYPLLPGYSDAGNGLEWRFGDKAAYGGCEYYRGCSIVVLQAFKDCASGVYVEGNVLDSSGAVVGMTNGTVAALREGQEAHVRLGVTEQDGVKVQLTKISCHSW